MKFRMNVHHVLFFCFLSGALCPTETYSGDFPFYTATEGQSISFEFPFTLAGRSRSYLCKGECKKKDILIKTPHATAQHGRYSIKYHEGVLQVTITELQTSDSGWYRCGVGNLSLSDSYELVEIRVKEVSHSVSPLIAVECATVVGFVLLAVFLLLLYKWKSKRETDGFNTRGNSDNTNMEFVTYENCPPLSTCEDSTYQALDPASRDQDQIYFTLIQDV
ncbi:uncharacterized protein LOC122882588 [Siniperca chuatsi]|uniref:uncharacterized protein LOC122882588 n=1 Tax=Siniperca chuatsi TaxID=119488 RepID=UPI001CE0CC12|nr:uncharacterized protein LOC122882588 [Siniperca chuatsi]